MSESITSTGGLTGNLATNDLLSGQINFTGLGSGTDFQTMIDKLVEIEGIHKQRLEIWKSQWEAKIVAFQALSSSMLALKTTLEGMDTPNEFLTKTATSSYESVATATANSQADEGNHSVTVNQLAQNNIITMYKSFDAKNSVISSTDSVLAMEYDGEDFDVSVPAGASLESMVGLINNHPDNPGIRASMVYDGTGYHLQLRGLDQGADYEVGIDVANTTLSNAGVASWELNQVAQNAQVRIDGYPAFSWIEIEGNTVKDVIEGVTFNLKGVTGSDASITVSVATDTESLKENIRTFVQQANEVRTLIIELTKFDSSAQEGSILTGNYGVQLISSQLKEATANKALGFDYYDAIAETGDLYTSLSQIGITTNAEEGSALRGLLILDEEELDKALNNNLDAVVSLFAANHEGEAIINSGSFDYYNHIDSITKAGSYDISYTSNGAAITSATVDGKTAQVSLGDDGYYYVTANSGDARGLAFRVLDSTASGSGTINIKQGKAGELADLLEELTSASSGPLHILEDNYNDIIDSIDDKIDYEERRLELYASRLKLQFARLESTLGTYNQIAGQLDSSIGQLE